MDDLISRQAAIAAMTNYIARWAEYTTWSKTVQVMVETAQEAAREMLTELPSAQPEVTEEAVKEYCRKRCLCIVDSALIKKYASAQPKKGKWEKIKVFPAGEIELQSARCSACKRYHTTPYLYNYTHYNFCPHCSARMVNEDV